MTGVLESSFVAGSVDAIDVWKKTIAALGENPSTVRFYGKSVQTKNVPGRLALREGKQFNIEFDDYSIRFVFIAISDIFVASARTSGGGLG